MDHLPPAPPVPEPLQLSWQPELADWVEAFDARNRARRVRLKLVVIAAVCAAVAGAGLVTHQSGMVGGGFAGLFGGAVVGTLGQRWSVRSLWRRAAALREPMRAQVSAAGGIVCSTPLSTGHYPWTSLEKVQETPRVFVLQMAGYRRGVILLLAKRGLADPGQLPALRWLLDAAARTPGRTAPGQSPPPR